MSLTKVETDISVEGIALGQNDPPGPYDCVYQYDLVHVRGEISYYQLRVEAEHWLQAGTACFYYYTTAAGSSVIKEPYIFQGPVDNAPLPWDVNVKISLDDDANTVRILNGTTLIRQYSLPSGEKLRRGDLASGNYSLVVQHGRGGGGDSLPTLTQAGTSSFDNVVVIDRDIGIFTDDFSESKNQWDIEGYLERATGKLRSTLPISPLAAGGLGFVYLPRAIGLAALPEIHRLTQIFANDSSNLKGWRRLPLQAMGNAATYGIGSNAADSPRGAAQIAGRLFVYFDRSGVAYYALSKKDGTEWLEADMAEIDAFAGYTLKHAVQQGRHQYAALYASGALYFSRNLAGDGVSWSSPQQIVGSLSSEPTAWLVPESDGSIRVYWQIGSDTPLTLATMRADGGGAWE